MLNCCDTIGMNDNNTCLTCQNKTPVLSTLPSECAVVGFTVSNCWNSNKTLWIDSSNVVCSPCRLPTFCNALLTMTQVQLTNACTISDSKLQQTNSLWGTL